MSYIFIVFSITTHLFVFEDIIIILARSIYHIKSR